MPRMLENNESAPARLQKNEDEFMKALYNGKYIYGSAGRGFTVYNCNVWQRESEDHFKTVEEAKAKIDFFHENLNEVRSEMAAGFYF